MVLWEVIIGRIGVNLGLDISAALKGGVYVLRHRGRVIYVGKAKVMLMKIMAHREGARKGVAPWSPVPGIVFDSVEIFPEHPDRVNALHSRLTDELAPSWNSVVHFPLRAQPDISIRRRF